MQDLLEIKLKQPLTDVKLAKDGNDVFICPGHCGEKIAKFLLVNNIPYTKIEDPKLYPAEEINRQLVKYSEPMWLEDDPDEIRELYGVTAIITKFDAEALFDWAMQILARERDPAYQAYVDRKRQEAEEYYEKYEKED